MENINYLLNSFFKTWNFMDFVHQHLFLIGTGELILLLIMSFFLSQKTRYFKKHYLIACKSVSKQLEEKVLQDIEIEKLIKELETKNKELDVLNERFKTVESLFAKEQNNFWESNKQQLSLIEKYSSLKKTTDEPIEDKKAEPIKQELKLEDLKEVTVEELQDNAKYILQDRYNHKFWIGNTLTDGINKADRVDKHYILRWLQENNQTSFNNTLIFETPEN